MAAPRVVRFAGHTHPDREFMHKFLLEKIGIEGWMAIRRTRWEMAEMYDTLTPDTPLPEREELKVFQTKRCPPINYSVDKGWQNAVDHFVRCVQSGTRPENATAEDGLKASTLSNAAIESRKSGGVVRL